MSKHRKWAILLFVLFLGLAALVLSGTLTELEAAVYNGIAGMMTPWLTELLRVLTHLGDPIAVALICLILLALPRRRTIGLPAGMTAAIAAGLNQILKTLTARERPTILWLIEETGFSFPSGHSMSNMALYGMLLLLLCRYRPRGCRALRAVCLALPMVIGFSRVYLGVHYAGDVLCGWLIGAAVALLAYDLDITYFHKSKGD